ncbi:hypothetical protein A176_000185 [Myxococcus hansupus]|uniref:Uncharacterized protein n=1 Tax=Pseudomyxococcus hansupus TaxID=1297742 RepID=A0A0H4WNX7_9BACT|nr:hypothetical protein [Myxococcus hansupus]AKQ63273.1 hypothetical protein A176_000185 [Myxococcus hansupus]
MRPFRQMKSALWAAVFSLALPLGEAQAQACVEFAGLQHCGVGAAKVSRTQQGVQIDNPDTSGKSGVAIHTPPAAAWNFEAQTDGAQRQQFTAYAESAPVSTSSVESRPDLTAYSATFTGSGEETTYSVLAYRSGRLVAAIGGVRSGEVGAVGVMIPTPGRTPSCRPIGQTLEQCRTVCRNNGYLNCNYCNMPCRPSGGFGGATYNSACFWRYTLQQQAVRLANGQTVEADEIVMQEEVSGPSNYPYLNFNRIDMQSTARTTVITGESIVPASK